MVECPECGRDGFTNIARHWGQSCSYPEPTERQQEIVKGMLLASNSVSDGKHQAVSIRSTSRPLLEWLSDELDWLATSICITKYAEQQAMSEEGYDCNDVYQMQTRRTPHIDTLHSEDPIENMTPTRAKVWYGARGQLRWTNSTSENAFVFLPYGDWDDRADDLREAFENVDHEDVEGGFVPRLWDDGMVFGVWDTTRFLPWLGDPIPGLEYLWARESRQRHRDLRSMASNSTGFSTF